MAILHKNITASGDIHNPKWHPDANNGDYAWKNEKGELESIDELLLPAALNFVDGSVAPPTSNTNDIYILSSGGSVNAGWGSVALQDWVKYDGAAWNAITPQKSSLCYDKTADALMSFDGTAWAAIGAGGGGDSIYTASGTVPSSTVATITDSLTFAGGKIDLSSVDDGILLNRVTNAEMISISGMATNEIVFNTTLDALYRYDGSNWIALAAGFGIVGTTDSAGTPSFYANVESAYIAAQGSIKLYSDITESVSRTINIVDGRDIDLNGFTYTYEADDATNMFDDTLVCSVRIINGRLIRKLPIGGTFTGDNYVFNFNLSHTQIDIVNVYAENLYKKVFTLKGTYNMFGSTFVSNSTGNARFDINTFVNGGTYIQKGSGSFSFNGDELKNAEVICIGSGFNIVRGFVYNCKFKSTTDNALQTTGTSTIVQCYAYALSGYAIEMNSAGEIYNSTFESGASCANFGQTADVKVRNCNFTAGSGNVVRAPKSIQDCILTNKGNGSGLVVYGNSFEKIISGNTINLEASTSGYGIYSISNNQNHIFINNNIFVNDSSNTAIRLTDDAYLSNNIIKGTTTFLHSSTYVNLFTATIDSAGNGAQL